MDRDFSSDGVAFVPCPPPYRCFGGGGLALEALSDGRLVLGGRFVLNDIRGTTGHRIVRVDETGELDPAFGVDGIQPVPEFSALAVDGERLLLVQRQGVAGKDRGSFQITRLLPDGSADASFGTGGKTRINPSDEYDVLHSIALQSGGRIVASGEVDGRFAVAGFRGDAGVANADADALDDSSDDCPIVYSDHRSGCPLSKRRLVLERGAAEGGARAFRGYAASKARVCIASNDVSSPRIFRRRRGPDVLVGRSHIGGNADRPDAEYFRGFELVRPAEPGVYYAEVPRTFEPDLGICKAARSRFLRVK